MEQTKKYKKIRTRGHRVVLNRSAGGDVGITIVLSLMGLFMFLPMYYVVIQSFKPLDELFMFPPRFWVMKPTFANFKDLFTLMGDSWVPFSRYIFNTVFITFCGTLGNLILASMAAYALAKINFPFKERWLLIIMLLMIVPMETIITIHFLFIAKLGLLNNIIGYVLPMIVNPFNIFLFRQAERPTEKSPLPFRKN